MWQYAIKILVTAAIVVAVTELSKRTTFWGAALASVPLTSILAFVWLYLETGDSARVAELSQGIFWLVLPSLILFVLLPVLLRLGIGFWLATALACVTTAGGYLFTIWLLNRLGIRP